MRKVLAECVATIGEVGNSEHMLRVLGKLVLTAGEAFALQFVVLQ